MSKTKDIFEKLLNCEHEPKVNYCQNLKITKEDLIKEENRMTLDEIYDDIFPLTIVKDRYMGVYSGGLFTAWNMYSECVPEEISDDDCTTFDFWNNDSKAYIIGIGKTPDEAVRDLYVKLKRRDKDENMTIYEKEQVLDGFTDLTIIDDEEEEKNNE